MLKVSFAPFKHVPAGKRYLWRNILAAISAVLVMHTISFPAKLWLLFPILLTFAVAAIIKYYISQNVNLKETIYIYSIWACYVYMISGSGLDLFSVILAALAGLIIYELIFSAPERFIFQPFIISGLFLTYFYDQPSHLNLDLATAIVIYAAAGFLVIKNIKSLKEIGWYFLPAVAVYIIGALSIERAIINLSAVLLILFYPGFLPISKIKRPLFIVIAVTLYFAAGLYGLTGALLFVPLLDRA
ncbi:MAG: hypothetical protein U9R36_03460 [Elusimicrobiota bacterium]|nr:hypothetical protein [Elusimicrobiota bacterium]